MMKQWPDSVSRLLIAALFVVVLAFNFHSFPKLVYNIQLPLIHSWPGGDMESNPTAIVFVDKAGRMIVASYDTALLGIDEIAANDYNALDKRIAAITQATTYTWIFIYADEATKYSVIKRCFKSIVAARDNKYGRSKHGWQKFHIVVRFKPEKTW